MDADLPDLPLPDAEAALEALRVAISHDAFPSASSPPAHTDPPTLVSAHELTQQSMDRNLAALAQLSASNQQILDNMNLPGMVSGLAGSLKLLVESNKRQAEIVRGVIAQLGGAVAQRESLNFVGPTRQAWAKQGRGQSFWSGSGRTTASSSALIMMDACGTEGLSRLHRRVQLSTGTAKVQASSTVLTPSPVQHRSLAHDRLRPAKRIRSAQIALRRASRLHFCPRSACAPSQAPRLGHAGRFQSPLTGAHRRGLWT